MKKVISIFLIAILLLNTVGFYGLFMGMYYQNEVTMTRALDQNNYDESLTSSIKIPVTVPYMADQTEFERVDGTIAHHGQIFRLVKQKYANDTLTIIYIKDTKQKMIDEGLADYVKTFTDKAADQKSSAKISFNFIKDYIATAFSIDAASHGWAKSIIHNSFYGNLIPSFTASVIHPPEKA